MIVLASANTRVTARWRTALTGMEPLMQVHDNAALLRVLEREVVNLVLVHLSLPGFSGSGGVAALREAFVPGDVMVFSDLPDDDEGMRVVGAGAVGYANSYIAPELLRKAVERVRLGEVWIGRSLIQRLITELSLAGRKPPANPVALEALTEREHEIAALVGRGASNKQIATNLDITERTVKAHLGSVFRKTGTHDRLQLALLVNGHRSG